MLYHETMCVFNRAVTALLGYHPKPNRAVNRPNSNRAVFRDRAVEISVHYTALYRPPLLYIDDDLDQIIYTDHDLDHHIYVVGKKSSVGLGSPPRVFLAVLCWWQIKLSHIGQMIYVFPLQDLDLSGQTFS